MIPLYFPPITGVRHAVRTLSLGGPRETPLGLINNNRLMPITRLTSYCSDISLGHPLPRLSNLPRDCFTLHMTGGICCHAFHDWRSHTL